MPGFRIAQFALRLGLMCAWAWASPLAGQNQGAEQTPVVRATTRLVVVNVVVQHKKGAPVTGLTRDDFTIFDGGRKQEISIFSIDSGRAVQGPAAPLPPNTFSNHVRREGGVPTSVTVILLDILNTHFDDLAWARRQLIKFLNELQPGDRVALCVLGRRLHVVQDFTSDPAPLLEALRREAGVPRAVPRAGSLSVAPPVQLPEELSDPASQIAVRLESGLADQTNAGAKLYRELLTCDVIVEIANHLSGLSGRKSLVWVTGGVPDPDSTDPRLEEARTRMIRALNEADMALYLVDARGLFVDPDFSVATRGSNYESGRGGIALAGMIKTTSAMIHYAGETGGRAFINTNDLKGSLRSALDDSELTYTLGYYPTGVRWDGQYRSIKVQVDRPGMQVRHRRGYLATAELGPEKTDPLAALKNALASPLDATALGLTATLTPVEKAGRREYHVTVLIDPEDVTFQPADGTRILSLDVMIGQYSKQGDPLGSLSTTISENLGEPDYKKIVHKRELTLTFDEHLRPAAMELRVAVGDHPSGAIGSLRIPLNSLRQQTH